MKIYDQNFEFENQITTEVPVISEINSDCFLPSDNLKEADQASYTKHGRWVLAGGLAGIVIGGFVNHIESTAYSADRAADIKLDEGSLDLIPCHEMNIDMSLSLDADAAKEAVANIEFFFDDPDMTTQAKEAIEDAGNQTEVQSIIQNIFESRGVNIYFGVPDDVGLSEVESPVDLINLKEAMNNLIGIYSTLPKELAEFSKDVYLANWILTGQADRVDGEAHEDGNKTVLNINALGNYDWGMNVVWHEYVHHLDFQACLAGSNQQDDKFDGLHSASKKYLADMPSDSQQRGLKHIFASNYAMKGPLEDKAETVAYLTDNYPDHRDADFTDSPLLHLRQQIMSRRLAYALGMPEIPKLFQFFDIYGTEEHPKRIVAEDLSPYSRSLSPRHSGEDVLYPVVSEGGRVDSFKVRHIDGMEYEYGMRTTIKIPAEETYECASHPDVATLSTLGSTLISQITGNPEATTANLDNAGFDPDDGKLICIIETFGSSTN